MMLLLGVFAVALAAAGSAQARSGYLTTFNSTYGTSGTALNTCNTCHGSGGTSTFNPYGNALRSNGLSFPAIESQDSDGDGFTNIVEINARTFPGDSASMPTSPPPPPSDTTPPSVSSTTPVNGATSVAPGSPVTAVFSEAVKNVTTSTFLLQAGSNAVAGTVTLNAAGTTATFTPSSPLAFATTYTATIGTGVVDLADNPLASNHAWSFTTGSAPDTTPPAVSSTTPADGAASVAAGSSVTAVFGEAVRNVTASTFLLQRGSNPVAGTVTLDAAGTTATFIPSSPLALATTYTATITTGVTDLASNPLPSNLVWSFTTGSVPDTTAPSVSSTIPSDGAASVAVDAAVVAGFSEAVDPATVSSATFTLRDPAGAPVPGIVSVAGAAATFTPSGSLGNGVTYTATVAAGVMDLAGNALSAAHSWSFTTVAATADSDGDGVENAMDAFPQDPTKATPPNPMGRGQILIDASGNVGTYLSMAGAMHDMSPMLNQTGKPATGHEFRHGLLTYLVEGVPVGGTVQVAITLPEAIPEGARVFKIDSSGFHEYPHAGISGNTVLLTLTDGGDGDADGVADGSIADPVGVAFPVASGSPAPAPGAPAPGTFSPDSSSGGCSVAGRAAGTADGAVALLLLLLPAALVAAKRKSGKA